MVECLILMSTALQKLVAQIHDNLDENDQFFPNMKLVIYKSYFDGLNLINFSIGQILHSKFSSNGCLHVRLMPI